MCFVYECEMFEVMFKFLCYKLKIFYYDSLIFGGCYYNFKDFIFFFNVGWDYLENKFLFLMICVDFEGYVNVFDVICV